MNGYRVSNSETFRFASEDFPECILIVVSLWLLSKISSVRPMDDKASSVREWMTNALDVVGASAAASRTMTLTPLWRSEHAADRPVGPLPMIATSTSGGTVVIADALDSEVEVECSGDLRCSRGVCLHSVKYNGDTLMPVVHGSRPCLRAPAV